MSIVVTGANGHLGSRLLPLLAQHAPVLALVRSANAAAQVNSVTQAMKPEAAARVGCTVLDYTDEAALGAALEGATEVVHLVGIIKEYPHTSYEQAHEGTTTALLAAAPASLQRIHYLSIVGSHPGAANACLASKGRAEQMLLDGPVPTTVIQVPMVLGEGDYASAAIDAQARRGFNVVFAAAARDQPIYAGDVTTAIVQSRELPATFNERLCLAGPEAVSKRTLITRAASVLGRDTTVVGLPAWIARWATRALEAVSSDPPITSAMLEILNHDDCYDPEPACRTLGLTLTPLDDTLSHVLRSV
ncbi:MAG: NAD-dependent epimerase/dehydratase family protein [Pseudomonadota bacterium]